MRIRLALCILGIQNTLSAVSSPTQSTYDPNTGTVKSEYDNIVEESEDAKSAVPKQATPPTQVQREQTTTIKERARPERATQPAQSQPGVSQDLRPTITDPSREQEANELIRPPPPPKNQDE